jgi:ribosomal protein S12 methylthiotransferase accessory factor
MARIGVTRIADVSGLDRPGIPNFVSVRPRDEGPGISYYNGKGTTRAQACAGAMMEAIERFSGEKWEGPVIRETFSKIARRRATVDPAEIIVPSVERFSPDLMVEWIEGWDFISKCRTYVPLNSVVCPYRSHRAATIHVASSNGLASGNCVEEAICHALCEVIERDATAIAYTRWKLLPAVRSVCASVGGDYAPDANPHKLIDVATVPKDAKRLLNKLSRAGLKVFLRDFTSTAGIAVVDCTVAEYKNEKCRAHGGCGAHPDSRIAILRAITEAAQSRVAAIQGGREDLSHLIRCPDNYDPETVFGGGAVCDFNAIPTFQSDHIDDDIQLILENLKKENFSQVVAVDLTKPELRVPVVRVVIPKAEAWPVFQLHTGSGVFGPRICAML